MRRTFVGLAAAALLVPVAADAHQLVYHSGLTMLAPVPEPAALALLGTGFLGLAALVRRGLTRR